METALKSKLFGKKRTQGLSAVLSSYLAQRTLRFTGIHVVFQRFKHRLLCNQWRIKGLKSTVENLAFPCLHGGSIKIRLQNLRDQVKKVKMREGTRLKRDGKWLVMVLILPVAVVA